MRLLLDTQVFLWAASDRTRLPVPALEAIRSPDNDVLVSAATAWEIAIKVAKKALDFPVQQFFPAVRAMDMELLPMTAAHALAAGALPPHHADPFDRMLVAQARLEGLVLVSVDGLIPLYEVPLLPLKG